MNAETKLTDEKNSFSWKKIKDNLTAIATQDLTAMIKPDNKDKDFIVSSQNKINGFEMGKVDLKTSLFLSSSLLQRNAFFAFPKNSEQNLEKNNEVLLKIFNKNLKNHNFLLLTNEKIVLDGVINIEQGGQQKLYLNLNSYSYIELVSLFSTLEPDDEDPEEREMWHKKFVDFLMAFSRIVFELGQKEKIDFPFVKNKINFKFFTKMLEQDHISSSGRTMVLKYLKSLPGFEEKNYFISEEMHNYLANKILASFQKLSEIYTDKNNNGQSYTSLDFSKLLEKNAQYQIVMYKNSNTSLFFLQEYKIALDKKVNQILELKELLKNSMDSKDKKEKKGYEESLSYLTTANFMFLNVKNIPRSMEKFISQCNLTGCGVVVIDNYFNKAYLQKDFTIKVIFKDAPNEIIHQLFPIDNHPTMSIIEKVNKLNGNELFVLTPENSFNLYLD